MSTDNEELNISPIHTSCKNCVFAIYNGVTQIDCAADQLEKFKGLGSIVEAFDNEKEFYIVNGRYCRMARSEHWKLKMGDKGLSDLIKIAREQNAIKYHALILVDNDLKAVKKTLSSLKRQKVKPQQVTLIRPFLSAIKPSELVFLAKKYPFFWKIQNLMADCDSLRGIDLSVKTDKSTFYAVFNAGYSINHNLFYLLNKKINEDYIEFGLIQPDKDGNGLIVLRHFHDLFAGNVGIPIYKKAEKEGIECPKIEEIIGNRK